MARYPLLVVATVGGLASGAAGAAENATTSLAINNLAGPAGTAVYLLGSGERTASVGAGTIWAAPETAFFAGLTSGGTLVQVAHYPLEFTFGSGKRCKVLVTVSLVGQPFCSVGSAEYSHPGICTPKVASSGSNCGLTLEVTSGP